MRRRYVYGILGLIILAGVVIAGLLYNASRQDTPTQPPQPSASQSPAPNTPEPSGTAEPETFPVKVFFSKRPESDNDPGATFAVSRTSPDKGVGKFAVSELIKGPSEAEKSQGYFTAVRLRSGESNCNGQDFTLNIENKTATLKFCRQFDHVGSVADGQAESELRATLRQFSSVEKVIILNRDNNCEFDLSGMNLCKQ